MPTIELIVGLANPGEEYAKTRHNAGAWFVEMLIAELSTTLRVEKKFHGLYGAINFHGKRCHLLIPTTYMNCSGQSVRACMNYLKLTPQHILIAHDDIDLPTGCARLKLDGGDGGHNGLKDIISHLDTKQFPRLRIGVDRPKPGHDVADYVLAKPSKTDREQINASLELANTVMPELVAGEWQKAMRLLHTTSE